MRNPWKERANACEDAASLYALVEELGDALETAQARYAEMEKACFCPCHKGTGDAQCKVNAGFEQLLLKYMALVGEEEGVYFLRRCEGKDIVSLAGCHGEIILSVEEQRTLLRIAHELSGE
jgi:hypothetical protein